MNAVAQQGFTRFAPRAGGVSARPGAPAVPRANALPGGAIAVSVQPPVDIDDTDLTVRLYRDGSTTPIATAPVHSLFWRRPIVTFIDTGVAAGTTHTYSVDALEKAGSQASSRSAATAGVTARSSVGAYQSAVLADSPTFLWRLGEPSGPVAADSSRGANGGTYWAGVAYGAPGRGGPATLGAITTDGKSGVVYSNLRSAPTAFSVETWFRTELDVRRQDRRFRQPAPRLRP